MSDFQYSDGDEERDIAQDHLRRIREGGEGAQPSTDPYGEELDSVSQAKGRASSARSALGLDEDYEPRGRAPVTAASPRANQAFIVIGGVVGAGILILIIIILISSLRGENGITLPFVSTKTPTPTLTPTVTFTPLPTETPTPTRVAPNLALPPLTCIFQSGAGCYDYCNDPANQGECQSAKDFVSAQGADPEVWLACIAPGPGSNVGSPQQCLEDAWRALNP